MPDVDETPVAREESKVGRAVLAAVVVGLLGLFAVVGFVATG